MVRLSDKVGLLGDLGGGRTGILFLFPRAVKSCTIPESLNSGETNSWLLTIEELVFCISIGCSRDVIGSDTNLSGFFLFCFVLLFSSVESVEPEDLDDQIFLKK